MLDRPLGDDVSIRVIHRLYIDYLCSLLEVDHIELVVVAVIEVIPHSRIRSKASMIFAHLSLTSEAIPEVSVGIWKS